MKKFPFLPLVESSISMALRVQWGSFVNVIFLVDLNVLPSLNIMKDRVGSLFGVPLAKVEFSLGRL